jgi:hypothetical protein
VAVVEEATETKPGGKLLVSGQACPAAAGEPPGQGAVPRFLHVGCNHAPSGDDANLVAARRCGCEAIHIGILTIGLHIGSPHRRQQMPCAR